MAIKVDLKNEGEVVTTWEHENMVEQNGKLSNALAIWDLFEIQHPWTEMQCQIRLSVEESEKVIAELLPADQQGQFMLGVLVSVPATRLRASFLGELGALSTVLQFKIEKDQVAGAVEMAPVLLLQHDNPDASPGWPKRKGSRLATGYPVLISVDESERFPGSGIEVKWERFPAEQKDALYKLDLGIPGQPKPQILINSTHPALKPVMDHPGRGGKGKIRDAIYAFIAADVWFQLLEYACSNDEESSDEPEAILADRILRTAMRKLRCDRNDISAAFENDSSRRDIQVRIQNMVSLAVRENDLIGGLFAEPEGSDDERGTI